MTNQNVTAGLSTQAEFAALMNVSRKTVTVWKQDGRLVMSGTKVDIEASKRLIEQTGGTRPDVAERHAAARAGEKAEPATETPQEKFAAMRAAAAPLGDPAEKIGNSLQAARAVKEKYSALKAKAEYETLIGDLIPREDVDAAMRFIGAAVRAALDVLPDQTAPLVAPITNLAECHETLTDACREALQGIVAAVERQKAEIFKGQA